MDNAKLPQWARDRLEAEEAMGEMETSASPLLIARIIVGWSIMAGLIALFCAAVYAIGGWVVG